MATILAFLPGGSSALILSGSMALVIIGTGRRLLREEIDAPVPGSVEFENPGGVVA